jgi:hypothetical protein
MGVILAARECSRDQYPAWIMRANYSWQLEILSLLEAGRWPQNLASPASRIPSETSSEDKSSYGDHALFLNFSSRCRETKEKIIRRQAKFSAER